MQKIDENDRMGKTIDLFKKIRDTKGKFHAKIGTKRTEMAWNQKKKILRRGGKNTQNYVKKVLMTQIITMV